jgi:hypothetical protein
LISRLLSSLLAALFLSGCDAPNEPLPYPLTISEEGLGAIHPDTPFDQINTSLNGFSFEKLSRISSEQSESIFQIKRGEKVIAQIISDSSGKKIASIHILSPLVKNRDNLGLGDPLPLSETLICTDEQCTSRDEPSLSYRIDPNGRTIREITFSRL